MGVKKGKGRKGKGRKVDAIRRMGELMHMPYGKVSVPCEFGDVAYDLVLLTAECEKDVALMNLLGRWRKENEFWFPAIFKVTLEGTTRWFRKGVLEAPDRILFMIKARGQYVGHVGLFRYEADKNSIEIDNIMRGEKPYPGIIANAITHMLRWGRKELGIDHYTLQTTSDNERSLRLYTRFGFVETRRVPQIRQEKEDRIEWVEAPLGYSGNVKRYIVFMELKHEVR